jgi:hypothetical protein
MYIPGAVNKLIVHGRNASYFNPENHQWKKLPNVRRLPACREVWTDIFVRIRTEDKVRLVKKLGKISDDTQLEVLTVLPEIFSE